jgi:hypothetical protein
VIDGLDLALEAWAPDGARELLPALEDVLGGPGVRGRLLESQRLPRDLVRRLRVELEGDVRSLVVKRFPAERAQCERAAIERWLPRAGLAAHGPPLLATVADRAGRSCWFVYEDLGPSTLAEHAADPGRVRAAVELLAELHARFREHPILGEVRWLGADLGMAFYAASVRDAARALEALGAKAPLAGDSRALCARLLERLALLRAEEPERAAALEASGAPETLLHGDPWTINVFVRPAGDGFEARWIDWDQAGVGPASYDLSTFLLRFPPRERVGILARYRERYALLVPGVRWPTRGEWNWLFDTAERARLAHTLMWRALAGVEGHLGWALEELAQVEEAFAALAPVLPAEGAPARIAASGAPGGRP